VCNVTVKKITTADCCLLRQYNNVCTAQCAGWNCVTTLCTNPSLKPCSADNNNYRNIVTVTTNSLLPYRVHLSLSFTSHSSITHHSAITYSSRYSFTHSLTPSLKFTRTHTHTHTLPPSFIHATHSLVAFFRLASPALPEPASASDSDSDSAVC
jgi:hypothetical protein